MRASTYSTVIRNGGYQPSLFGSSVSLGLANSPSSEIIRGTSKILISACIRPPHSGKIFDDLFDPAAGRLSRGEISPGEASRDENRSVTSSGRAIVAIQATTSGGI